MATKRPTRKNPATSIVGDEVVRHWVLKPHGDRVSTAAIRTEHGYVATVIQNSNIVATASDKRTAEKEALNLYLRSLEAAPARPNPVYDDETNDDADDIRALRQREGEPFLTREEFLRSHGRRP